MKNILALAVLLTATASQASVYECKLNYGNATTKETKSITFDTVAQDNKFIDIGNNVGAGCVVLRFTPELVTCGVASDQKFSMFSTVENGSSIVALHSTSADNFMNIDCIKK